MTRWLLLVLAACGTEVDLPMPDYQGWTKFEIRGDAPGHSNSVRWIFANDLAVDPMYPLLKGYQDGSILVKETYELANGERGALRNIAVMRRIGEVDRVLEDQGGWMFSETSGPTGPEEQYEFCWQRCHVAAPYNGAWYDYRAR